MATPPAVFRVLDASSPDERLAWIALWNRWPRREVQAHPDYVRLFARENDEALALTLESRSAAVIFPLVRRPLRVEPWADDDERATDVTTPYGYGGPFAWGETDEATAQTFWRHFDDWASRHDVVTCFARLSLFPDELLSFHPKGEVEENNLNVVRGLDPGEDDLWYDYRHKVRKNVKRARRSGVVVEVDEAGDRLDDFLDIYYATMDRRDAGRGYYFPRAFFEAIVLDLGEQAVFFHACQGERVVSTELVLVSQRNLYSFLGGTREAAFSLRPNDLLKHEIILWGRRAGKRAFVLGGGYQRGDGIYRFKRSFAPEGDVPFYVARLSSRNDEVERLVGRRREYARAQGTEWTPRAGFFPTYRA